MPYSVKMVKGNKRENYTKRLHTLIAIHYNDTYDLTCHHQLHLIQSFTEGIRLTTCGQTKIEITYRKMRRQEYKLNRCISCYFRFHHIKRFQTLRAEKTWSFQDVLAFLLKPITGGFVCYRRIFLNQCVGGHPYLSAQFIKEIKNNIGLENFVLLYIKQDENKC